MRAASDIEPGFPPAAPRTIRSAWLDASRLLAQSGVENAKLDAEVLLRHALIVERSELYADLDRPLVPHAEARLQTLVARRARREPLAYVTGHKEFWSLDFVVTRDVLIPRPETELLVELALGAARGRGSLNILELGTGSGAVAVCLAKELADACITALDISASALAVARLNASRNAVAERIRFAAGDLFAPLNRARARFDLVIANAPYVARAEWAELPPEVRDWEPRQALDGGEDGFDVYERIIAAAPDYLADGGVIAVEIGAGMAARAREALRAAARFGPASVYHDYAGRDRVVTAQRMPRAG